MPKHNIIIIDGREVIVEATLEQIEDAFLKVPESHDSEDPTEKRRHQLVYFGDYTFVRSHVSGWRSV
jgi:hypothetical protein